MHLLQAARYEEFNPVNVQDHFPGLNAHQQEAPRFQLIAGLKVTDTLDQCIMGAAAQFLNVTNDHLLYLFHGTGKCDPYDIIRGNGLDRVHSAISGGANYCGLRNYMALFPEYSFRWAHYPDGTFAVMLIVKCMARKDHTHELPAKERMDSSDPKWITSPTHDVVKGTAYSVSNYGVRSAELTAALNHDINPTESVIFASDANYKTCIVGIVAFGLKKWTESARNYLRDYAGLAGLPVLLSKPWCVHVHVRMFVSGTIVFALLPEGVRVTFDDVAWNDAPKVSTIDELAGKTQIAGLHSEVRAMIIHGGKAVNLLADLNYIPAVQSMGIPTAVLTQTKQERFDKLNRATLGGGENWATVHQHDRHDDFLKDPKAFVAEHDTWTPRSPSPDPMVPGSPRSPSPALAAPGSPRSPCSGSSPVPLHYQLPGSPPHPPPPLPGGSPRSRPSRSPSPPPAKRHCGGWQPPRSPTPSLPKRRSPSPPPRASKSPMPHLPSLSPPASAIPPWVKTCEAELRIVNRKIAQFGIDRQRLTREIAVVFQGMAALSSNAAVMQAGSAYNDKCDELDQIEADTAAALRERKRLTDTLGGACAFCGQRPCNCIVIQ